jgi:hypothetical protein
MKIPLEEEETHTHGCGLWRRLDEDEFALLEALAAARSLFNTTGAHAIWFSDTRQLDRARKIFAMLPCAI